jgi:hypothetical protein
MRVETKRDPADYPVVAGFDASRNGAREAIIPARTFKRILDAAKRPKKGFPEAWDYAAVTMHEERRTEGGEPVTRTVATFASAAGQSVAQVEADGLFPMTDDVWPKDPPTARIYFDARLLGETLMTLVRICEDARRWGDTFVELDLHGQDKAARLRVFRGAPEGMAIEAIIMPVNRSKV